MTLARASFAFAAALALWGCGDASSPPQAPAPKPARLADDPTLPRADSVAAMQTLVDEVRKREYAELASYKIVLDPLESESDFFTADVDTSTIGKPAAERTYRVRYNPKLFGDPPSNRAVFAILVHELKHVLDYTKKSTEAELVDFGVKYALDQPFRTAYERATDEHALSRGYGEGLKDYRYWLYDRITPDKVEEKRRDYYTPEEIDAYRPPPK
ncbi:MAG: hypothetical protein KC657_01220 [Myxococcales bacterium]|nr:hypothetical protein [Myxococcales bacterium]